MPNQGKLLKKHKIPCAVFVKSLSWLDIETCVSKLSKYFYRNIVYKNVSCDVGLNFVMEVWF